MTTLLLLFTLLTLLQQQSSFYSFNSAQALPASMMNIFSYNNPLSALFRNTDLKSRNKPFFFSSSESSPQTQQLYLMNEENEQQKLETFNSRETLEIESPIEKQEKTNIKQGALKLCPPGGRSFFEAFELACPMRRRKKRHTIFGISTQIQPKMFEKTTTNNNKLDYFDDENEEYQNDKIKYRPANISEIMRICCVNGCEFSDFFPHCGPFSTW